GSEPRAANREPPTSDINLLVLPQDAAERIRDLSQCRVCLDGVDHEGNQIRRIARRGGQSIQRGAPDRRFTGRAHGTDALDLTPFDLGVDAKDVDRSALLGREAIDADDHTPAAIDLL